MKWESIFLLLAGSCAAVGIKVAMDTSTLTGYTTSLVLLAWSGVFLHIWSLQPAHNLPFFVVLKMYFQQRIISTVGNFILWRFNSLCRDVNSAQTKTLFKLLKLGQDSVYGRDFNLAAITSVAEFRSRMRLTEYNDYKPYIERCLAGEENIFFKQEVDFFAATSGTTSGRSKLYPINVKANSSLYGPYFVIPLSTALSAAPKLRKLRLSEYMMIPAKKMKTEIGVSKGSVSMTFLRHETYYCTPKVANDIYSEHESQYVHMVFALRERDLGAMYAMTSTAVLQVLTLVEQNWRRLVRDIRRGELDEDLEIAQDVRESLNSHLTPLPERADKLEEIFRSGCKDMVPRIWPHLGGISSICTGTFALQAKLTRERYLGDTIPLYSFCHMSTECMYGTIVYTGSLCDPDTCAERDDYVILPGMNFYEFIPAEHTEDEQPDTLLAHQVESGKDYELVVTTPRGLYRFRSGDMVRVCGFSGNTPRYKMLQRRGDILNVYLEKVPEFVVREAIAEASTQWTSGKLVNFVSTENIHVDTATGTRSDALYYVIFVETDPGKPLLAKEESSVRIKTQGHFSTEVSLQFAA
ncbi:indole-3-acetic acid-amido synthetase GH3.2-like isoform X2 [Haliotis rubra]|uniref:indole-3-acetic acid-amido synthetase GH3.2-like isoform X2 n=1 Tax=Haliotis rubra TaxID=36100 RepID=UPI001EE5B9FE|nr:indole-3-acetic acid-amido synthetase GH3.2-like isoform X2 [Haliotis rubra]